VVYVELASCFVLISHSGWVFNFRVLKSAKPSACFPFIMVERQRSHGRHLRGNTFSNCFAPLILLAPE
jgi:hypothetical protein